MIVKKIKYEDFNGNQKETTAYFNINEVTLAKVGNEINEIINTLNETQNTDIIADLLSRIILMSYGKKSENGESFIQSKAVQEEFEYSAAYPALFMELAQDGDKFVEFLKGALPKSLISQIDMDNLSTLPLNK